MYLGQENILLVEQFSWKLNSCYLKIYNPTETKYFYSIFNTLLDITIIITEYCDITSFLHIYLDI
jgi:hypothetical protein